MLIGQIVHNHWIMTRGGFRSGSQGSGTLSAFSNLSNNRVRDLKTSKLIDLLGGGGDWNAVPVLMTGLQNKTDSLSFIVNQLGCLIDLKISAVTIREGGGNTSSRCSNCSPGTD